MASKNRPTKHFNSLEFGDTSVFTSKFPVDLSHAGVRKDVRKNIPAYLDTMFLFKPSVEEFSTERPGRLSLHPAMTEIALKNMDGQDKKNATHRHDTLRALTDGGKMTVAHVQINRDGGSVTDFSIAATSEPSSPAPVYELRGAMNIVDEVDVFEIAKTIEDDEEWSMLVDDDIAKGFVHALYENRLGHTSEPVPLEAGLMRLLDTSSQVYHQQALTSEVDETTGVSLTAERRSRIQKGITKVAAYSVIRHEVQVLGDIEIHNTFGLTYDLSGQPRYTADLAYMMRALSEHPTHEEREAHFENWSIHYRQNPERMYAALAETVRKLTTFEL